MKAVLHRALNLVLGSSVGPVRTADELSILESLGSPPVFSFSPSRDLTENLRRKGYANVNYFNVLPSRGSPRWLLPSGTTCEMLAGTQIYWPHRLAPRVIKGFLIGMIKMGWHGWSGCRVLVASQGASPLEILASTITGEHHPVFALSLGRQTPVGKLTVQIMRQQGDILGYIKLPLTDAATERVRNEATILERLWKFTELRPHIPHLLYAGNWNDTYVLVQSALEGDTGPLRFNDLHHKFLRTLRNIHGVDQPGQTLVGKVAAKWEKVAPVLGAKWTDLGKEVLQRSTRELRGKMLRYSVTHGDFAPWNTRAQKQELLVFDWESAEWEAPSSWDIFHFDVQTAYRSKINSKTCIPAGLETSNRPIFMLYLLNSVCQFLREGNHEAIAVYENLLISKLRIEGSATEALPSCQALEL